MLEGVGRSNRPQNHGVSLLGVTPTMNLPYLTMKIVCVYKYILLQVLDFYGNKHSLKLCSQSKRNSQKSLPSLECRLNSYSKCVGFAFFQSKPFKNIVFVDFNKLLYIKLYYKLSY
jgi:hypothetical protein